MDLLIFRCDGLFVGFLIAMIPPLSTVSCILMCLLTSYMLALVPHILGIILGTSLGLLALAAVALFQKAWGKCGLQRQVNLPQVLHSLRELQQPLLSDMKLSRELERVA